MEKQPMKSQARLKRRGLAFIRLHMPVPLTGRRPALNAQLGGVRGRLRPRGQEGVDAQLAGHLYLPLQGVPIVKEDEVRPLLFPRRSHKL